VLVQKSPTSLQTSPVYVRKSPVHLRKSPVYLHKRPSIELTRFGDVTCSAATTIPRVTSTPPPTDTVRNSTWGMRYTLPSIYPFISMSTSDNLIIHIYIYIYVSAYLHTCKCVHVRVCMCVHLYQYDRIGSSYVCFRVHSLCVV